MERACESSYKVFTDLRWPLHTGIGNVMTSLVKRAPSRVNLVDLNAQRAIGHPFSPLKILRALKCVKACDGVFWSAGFVPPAGKELPSVVTVHDLTHLRFYTRFHRAYYNLFFKPLYRRCGAIICVSDYTRRQFLAWSGMPRDKVHVVLNGVSSVYGENQASFGLPYRYVLYPGNHRAYKNLNLLIAAFAASSLSQQNIHLVMTGAPNQVLLAQARRLGIESYLHFLGRVEAADLPKIYKGALLVAFVSLYEGFGLPILEAMASGVPVLTSNVSSMPEVAGDAALIVDPYSVEAVAKGLDVLAFDAALRSDFVGKGRQQAARFDWDKSANELWSIVDNVYKNA